MEIRSNVIETLGSLPEMAERESMLKRRIDKSERELMRAPKNSAEMLYSSVKTLQRSRDQYQRSPYHVAHLPKLESLSRLI